MKSYYLPCYTIGTDAFDNFENVMSFYGRKVALLYGERAEGIRPEFTASRQFGYFRPGCHAHMIASVSQGDARICKQ